MVQAKASTFPFDSFQGVRICNKITDKIWLGSLPATKHERLEENKITHVLSAGYFPKVKDELPEFIRCQLMINVLDLANQDIYSKLDEGVDFIKASINESDDSCILVHCQEGKSRSTSFIIAYFIREEGMTYMDAWDKVRRERWIANPNQGFVEQIKRYEEALKSNNPK